MSSTYSTNLGIELIGTGDQAGTWGTSTNNNLGTLIEQAISGYVTQAITDGADTVITIPNGVTGVARNMYIECTGALTAARNLIVPSNKKLYFIYNNTTGGYAVTVKVSGQTGVSVPNGSKMVLTSNGTDVVQAVNYMISPTFLTPNLGTPSAAVLTNATGLPLSTGVTGTLPVTAGGTGVTTLAGLAYGNGTSAFTAATGSQIASAIGSTAVTNANNIAGGVANQIPYQTGASATTFIAAPSTASTYLSWNGTAFTWASIGSSTAQALSFNNSGSGAPTGTSFNGSTAYTISYNTIGAPSVSGTNATGTWGIGISGNAATVTNGVYTTGSYADPVWLTSLAGSKVSGNISGNAANVTGTVAVANGGTGATTLTGYVYGNGTSAMTASTTIPGSAISGNISGNAANVTGTVAVANGGTGVTTLSGLAYGNGTSAFTAATGAQIVSAIGSTAVTNATNATNATTATSATTATTATSATTATTATNATNLATTNFTIQESGGKLIFKYGGTTIASLDSSGNFTTLGNTVAGGTP